MKRLTGILMITFLLTQLAACGGGGGGGSAAATTTDEAVTGLTVPAQVPVVTPSN